LSRPVVLAELEMGLSPLLYSANRGDTMLDFTESTAEEANEIVGRIRAQANDRE
jgi:hypothetical protein